MHITHNMFRQLLAIFLILLLTACGGGGGSSGGGQSSEEPTITGELPELALVGVPLNFVPEVKGLAGQLTFSLENSPDWLSINLFGFNSPQLAAIIGG